VVVHRPGTKHENVNGLSRKPFTKDDVAESADSDEEVPTKTNVKVIHDGVVYRRNKSPREGKPDFKQLLLPRMQVKQALTKCHAGTVAKHFGIQKTIDQVQRRFY